MSWVKFRDLETNEKVMARIDTIDRIRKISVEAIINGEAVQGKTLVTFDDGCDICVEDEYCDVEHLLIGCIP